MTPAFAPTRFERRRRRVPIWPDRVDQAVKIDPEELRRSVAIETRAIKRARVKDARFDLFGEFFGLEYRKYGPLVRPGLLALCWCAGPGPHGILPELDELTVSRSWAIRFVHWAAPDAGFHSYLYLAEAIDDFIELAESGRLPAWQLKHERKRAQAQALGE